MHTTSMASNQDAVAVYVELSAAVSQLRVRGLHQSVKWAAEQLVGLPEEAWELGAAQSAKLSAQQPELEHPKLVQGRNFFELKVCWEVNAGAMLPWVGFVGLMAERLESCNDKQQTVSRWPGQEQRGAPVFLVADKATTVQLLQLHSHNKHVQSCACTGKATHNMAPTCLRVKHMPHSPCHAVPHGVVVMWACSAVPNQRVGMYWHARKSVRVVCRAVVCCAML
jgi:hypothetical protein